MSRMAAERISVRGVADAPLCGSAPKSGRAKERTGVARPSGRVDPQPPAFARGLTNVSK